jgi:hypothetical protein
MGKSRPRYLTVICVLWLVWGACNVLFGLWDLSMNLRAFEQMAGMMPSFALSDARLVIFLNVAIIGVSLTGFVGAAWLLWLRSWARALLVLANWGMVLIIACIAWQAMQIEAVAEFERSGRVFLGDRVPTPMDLDGTGFANTMLAAAQVMLGALPFAYIIKKLRQPETHQAIFSQRMRELTSAAEALPPA